MKCRTAKEHDEINLNRKQKLYRRAYLKLFTALARVLLAYNGKYKIENVYYTEIIKFRVYIIRDFKAANSVLP